MKKKCKVVMLPTEINTNIGLLRAERLGYIPDMHNNGDWEFVNTNWKRQHLYITSDDEIKEGDWFIYGNKVIKSDDNSLLSNKLCQKIIATTDKSLLIKSEVYNYSKRKYNLPQIPKAFIEEYCKVGGINEVMVEYTNPSIISYKGQNGAHKIPSKPKTNSINEILIYPIKNSWNREEVEEIVELYEAILNGNFFIETKENMKKRIQQILN